MNIIVNVPIMEIETYKETITKLNDAFCNCMSWHESVYSINDEDPTSVIIEGWFGRYYDVKNWKKPYKVEYVFIIHDNMLEHASMKLKFYDEKDEKSLSDEEYRKLINRYTLTIMYTSITPLKLYRLICVLFANELKINDLLLEEDQMKYFSDNFFLQSLRENKSFKINKTKPSKVDKPEPEEESFRHFGPCGDTQESLGSFGRWKDDRS